MTKYEVFFPFLRNEKTMEQLTQTPSESSGVHDVDMFDDVINEIGHREGDHEDKDLSDYKSDEDFEGEARHYVEAEAEEEREEKAEAEEREALKKKKEERKAAKKKKKKEDKKRKREKRNAQAESFFADLQEDLETAGSLDDKGFDDMATEIETKRQKYSTILTMNERLQLLHEKEAFDLKELEKQGKDARYKLQAERRDLNEMSAHMRENRCIFYYQKRVKQIKVYCLLLVVCCLLLVACCFVACCWAVSFRS